MKKAVRELQQILLEVIKTGEVHLRKWDAFGQRYTFDFSLEWQNRRAILRISSMTQQFQD